ncbi:hypothetical protein [Bisbaumannia salifodinae]
MSRVNAGYATAKDMLKLVKEVQSSVYDETGYCMEPEVRFVKPTGDVVPLDSDSLDVFGK